MSRPFKFRYANEIAGAFVVLALLAFVAGVFVTGYSKGWFEGRFELTGRFNESEQGFFGLEAGADVLVMNTLAGRVARISPSGEGRMEVSLLIQNSFMPNLRTGAIARVKRKFGLAGDAYVEIEPGEGPPITDGAVIPCVRDKEIIETARKMLADVQDEILPMLEDVKEILEHANAITAGIAGGEGLAGAALRDAEMVKTVKEILEGTKTLMGESERAIQESTRLIRGAQKHWLIRKYIEEDESDVVLSPVQIDPAAGDAMEQHWRTALAAARLENRPARIARNALNLAYVHLAGNDPERSRELLTEAAGEIAAAGLDSSRAHLFEVQLVLAEGAPADALSMVAGLGGIDRDASRELAAMWAVTHAALLLENGDVEGCAAALAGAERKIRRAKSAVVSGVAAGLQARLFGERGDSVGAAGGYDRQAASFREAGLYHAMALALDAAGKAFSAGDRYEQAADRHYRSARSLFSAGNEDMAAGVLIMAHEAALKTGDRELIHQVVVLAREHGIDE